MMNRYRNAIKRSGIRNGEKLAVIN
ncbi:hypothetical protein NPIL_284671, partial [Nephila pilipes]